MNTNPIMHFVKFSFGCHHGRLLSERRVNDQNPSSSLFLTVNRAFCSICLNVLASKKCLVQRFRNLPSGKIMISVNKHRENSELCVCVITEGFFLRLSGYLFIYTRKFVSLL